MKNKTIIGVLIISIVFNIFLLGIYLDIKKDLDNHKAAKIKIVSKILDNSLDNLEKCGEWNQLAKENENTKEIYQKMIFNTIKSENTMISSTGATLFRISNETNKYTDIFMKYSSIWSELFIQMKDYGTFTDKQIKEIKLLTDNYFVHPSKVYEQENLLGNNIIKPVIIKRYEEFDKTLSEIEN